jgi:hypothetical protein
MLHLRLGKIHSREDRRHRVGARETKDNTSICVIPEQKSNLTRSLMNNFFIQTLILFKVKVKSIKN